VDEPEPVQGRARNYSFALIMRLSPRLFACLLLLASCERETLLENAKASTRQSFAIEAFSGIALRDQEGRELEAEQLAGKLVVLSFMFTSCPRICPEQTRALAEVRRGLSRDVLARVQFLSISIDPENDTPERLKSFAKTNGADVAGWSFVVGTPEATRSLSSRLSVFDPRTASPRPGDHGTALYLFDDRGQLRQRYAGSPLDGRRLSRELLQLEALCRRAPASSI
jgi:protein SCO1/2